MRGSLCNVPGLDRCTAVTITSSLCCSSSLSNSACSELLSLLSSEKHDDTGTYTIFGISTAAAAAVAAKDDTQDPGYDSGRI